MCLDIPEYWEVPLLLSFVCLYLSFQDCVFYQKEIPSETNPSTLLNTHCKEFDFKKLYIKKWFCLTPALKSLANFWSELSKRWTRSKCWSMENRAIMGAAHGESLISWWDAITAMRATGAFKKHSFHQKKKCYFPSIGMYKRNGSKATLKGLSSFVYLYYCIFNIIIYYIFQWMLLHKHYQCVGQLPVYHIYVVVVWWCRTPRASHTEGSLLYFSMLKRVFWTISLLCVAFTRYFWACEWC